MVMCVLDVCGSAWKESLSKQQSELEKRMQLHDDEHT